MKKITIGVIDYGMGNHASVVNCLRNIGFRVNVSSKIAELKLADLLILPGVGAFPFAMTTLNNLGLVDYLQKYAVQGRPLIGICLGMQLLASASYEHSYTTGLGLIPGKIVSFCEQGVHIGWNTLQFTGGSRWGVCDRDAFYFNHSFYYQGLAENQVAVTSHYLPFPSIIQHGNIVGLQFHPEKSQVVGKTLIKTLITGMVHA